jgi:signal transduction histidine kinase
VTRRALAVDALLAGAFAALGVAIALSLDLTGAERIVAVVLVVAHVAPLAARRRWPLAVLAAMAITALLAPVFGIPVVALGPAALVAIYSVGAAYAPPRSTAVVGVASVVMAVTIVASGMDPETVATNVVAFVVAWWLGDRHRRAGAAAEAERDAAADLATRAVVAERLRIARELHDIVAHAMSLIAVQAGSGRLVIDESPEVARQALATIETTSRGALQEMRRLLSVLRDDSDPTSALAPSPSVDDIDGLVSAARASGLDVRFHTEGDAVALPAGSGLCVYRIVQEALTNVRKHADAQSVDVTLRFGPAALEVEVVDDGLGTRAVRSNGAGHGLVGLRERAELYGGTLETTAQPNSFRVHACIPLADAP